jgi:hypothetical protein
MKKQNCWEFKRCGRGPDGKNDCTVARDHMFNGVHEGMNGGRACWAVAGTGGNAPASGTFAIVLRDCLLRCDFFKLVETEERGSEMGFSATILGMQKMIGSKKTFSQNAPAALKSEQIDLSLRNEFAQEINSIASGKSDISGELIEEFSREVERMSSNTNKKDI